MAEAASIAAPAAASHARVQALDLPFTVDIGAPALRTEDLSPELRVAHARFLLRLWRWGDVLRDEADLAEAFTTAGPDAEVGGFTGPTTVAWWERRQLHETLVHRLDAELAVGFFGSRYDRATPAEREYMHAMAELGGPQGAAVSTSDVAATLGRKPASLSPARDSLIKKGLVYSAERGQIAFTVPHFGKFLRRSA